MKKYLIHVWRGVEPFAYGPYKTNAERDHRAKMEVKRMSHMDSIFCADILNNGKLKVWSYATSFFEEE